MSRKKCKISKEVSDAAATLASKKSTEKEKSDASKKLNKHKKNKH